ncbi:MAG TPA: hypothetical protein DDZ51_28220 [Planctomycetaceae bacterium]|nr:hypothetical protein [Planctomycetaceae bacterium]
MFTDAPTEASPGSKNGSITLRAARSINRIINGVENTTAETLGSATSSAKREPTSDGGGNPK